MAGPRVSAKEPERCGFSGTAWVGGEWRHAESFESDSGYRLVVEDGSPVFIDRQGVVSPETHAGLSRLELAVRDGPAKVVALAFRGVFCLHASAIRAPGGVVAFVGPSGSGKSTLAELLAGLGHAPVADDILPVGWSEAGAVALPGFEQPAACEPLPPEGLPLLAVYRIETPSSARFEAVSEPLPGLEGLRALAANTVAACLFGPALLTAHLEHCAELARRVPIHRLRYPRHREVGPLVAKELHVD